MRTQPDVDEVVAAIRSAFHEVRRGEGFSLHETEVIDDRGPDEERAAARLLDQENSWQEIPAELLEKFGSALAFMNPEGFRYYIPAFMIWTLLNYQTSRAWAIDSTIYALELTNNPNVFAQRLSEFQLLNREQHEAIALFLLYMSHEKFGSHPGSLGARRALDTYWAPYIG
jgi:uncharacterized protein DUF6714